MIIEQTATVGTASLSIHHELQCGEVCLLDNSDLPR